MTTCVLAHRGGAREEGLEHGAGRTGMDAWEVARVGTRAEDGVPLADR